jgi:hypothetical protein
VKRDEGVPRNRPGWAVRRPFGMSLDRGGSGRKTRAYYASYCMGSVVSWSASL